MTTPTTPANNGPKVSTNDYSWQDMVLKAWGGEYYAPDHGVYSFSNGRRFDSTDKTSNGIYNGGAV